MAREAVLLESVVEGLSGHSAGVGTAQTQSRPRTELPAILQSGRWKSTTLGEPLRRAAAGPRRSDEAPLAALQNRE